jgi:hypothetical protein
MNAAQLSLFAGKRQRGTKLPPAKEFPVHCMIADLLRLSLMPGWIWFHPANGEFRDRLTGARLRRMGVKPGVSDFILIAPPTGCVHVLELKRQGLKPTREQQDFLLEVAAAGGKAAWVDSFDDAKKVLKSWCAVRVAA